MAIFNVKLLWFCGTTRQLYISPGRSLPAAPSPRQSCEKPWWMWGNSTFHWDHTHGVFNIKGMGFYWNNHSSSEQSHRTVQHSRKKMVRERGFPIPTATPWFLGCQIIIPPNRTNWVKIEPVPDMGSSKQFSKTTGYTPNMQFKYSN